MIAKDPTSAIPRPSSAVRSNRSRFGSAGGSGDCAHCSDSASRRFVIHPMPEYSAASRPKAATVFRWAIAWSMIGLIVSAMLGGRAALIASRISFSRFGLKNST